MYMCMSNVKAPVHLARLAPLKALCFTIIQIQRLSVQQLRFRSSSLTTQYISKSSLQF